MGDVCPVAGPALDPSTAADSELAELYRLHGRRIHAICRAYLGDADSADDAVQEVFLRAGTRVSLPRRAPIEAYLFGIARNVCLMELRRRRTARRHRMGNDPSSVVHPDEVALRHELLTAVWLDLSVRDRLLMLHRFAGYSRLEIASRLRMTVKAVDMGLMRARQHARRLAEALEEMIGIAMWPRRRSRRPRVRGGRRASGTVAHPCAWTAVVIAVSAIAVVDAALPARVTRLLASTPTATVVEASGMAPAGWVGVPAGVSLTAVTVSPAYRDDHTVFATGQRTGCAPDACAMLYRSGDGGASWKQLPARGFAGGRILVVTTGAQPAAVSAQRPALLASGARGLQRSDDGGASFRTVAPAAGPAAVPPRSNRVAGVVVTVTQRVQLYDVRTGALTTGPVLPAGDRPVDAVMVDDRTVLVSVLRGRQDRPAAVVRCDLGGGCREILVPPPSAALRLATPSDGREVAVTSDHTLYLGTADGLRAVHDLGSLTVLALAASHDARGQLVLVAIGSDPTTATTRVLISRDGGRTFSTIAPAADLSGVRSLAVTPDATMVAAITAAGLPLRLSRDGSRWAPVWES